MPNCIEFTSKVTGQVVTLGALDEELCDVAGVPVHERNWCFNWFDVIGGGLAAGKSFGNIATEVGSDYDGVFRDVMLKMCKHLDANYRVRAWYQNKG